MVQNTNWYSAIRLFRMNWIIPVVPWSSLNDSKTIATQDHFSSSKHTNQPILRNQLVLFSRTANRGKFTKCECTLEKKNFYQIPKETSINFNTYHNIRGSNFYQPHKTIGIQPWIAEKGTSPISMTFIPYNPKFLTLSIAKVLQKATTLQL